MEDLDFCAPAEPKPQPAAQPAVRPAPQPAAPSAVQPAARPAAPPQAPAPAPALPDAKSLYNPALALKFFQIAGEVETVPAGARIFAEQEQSGGFFAKGARVYLLLEGEVALTLQGKPLSLVMPGELLGELAIITGAPRSATATARKACRLLSLDEKRFLASLEQVPEFSLMLIGIMAQRLVHGVDRLLAMRKGPMPPRQGGFGLDAGQLAELKRAMGNPTPTPMRAGDAIVSKGAVGVSMFVVTAGQIAISVNDRVVETVGPGETFGEMAVLGPNVRAATAAATGDGAWLAISRDAFLGIVRSRPAIGIALLRSISERLQHLSKYLGS